MKKRYFIFLLLLVFPFSFIFSACKEQVVIIDISIILDNNFIDSYVEKYYGDNAGLYDFTIKAYYSDYSSKDITHTCTISVTDPDDNKVEYDDYLQLAYSNELRCGRWTLELYYEEYSTSYIFNILEPINTNIYNFDIFCTFNKDLEKNTFPYGTKFSGLDTDIYENGILMNPADIQSTSIYILKQDCSYTDDLVPSFENVTYLNNIENLTPGTYYFCASIKKDGYSETFSSFLKINIIKAKFFIDSSDLLFEWSFGLTGKTSNISFSEMQEDTNNFIDDGCKLIVCSDYDDTNNEQYGNYNYDKVTTEKIVWYYKEYGKFEINDPTLTYNANDEYQNIALKFVPIGEENCSLYETSDVFVAKIKINKCTIALPEVEITCCNYNHIYAPNKTHSLRIYAPYTDLYNITTESTIVIDNDYRIYSTEDVKNIVVNYKLKYTQNYEWTTSSSSTNGVYFNLNSNTGLLTIELEIEKGDLNDYNLAISYTDGSGTTLGVDNKINLKLTDLVNGQEFLDGEYTWEILPIGINDNYVCLATGEINDYELKPGNSLFKTLTITEILESTKKYDNITFAITIRSEESDRWLRFEKTFLLSIGKPSNN